MTAAPSKGSMIADVCIWTAGGLDESTFRNSGNDQRRLVEGGLTTRMILLRPENPMLAAEVRGRSIDHDRIATFVVHEGAWLGVTLVGSIFPAKRFRDYGPRALLTLYSDDQIWKAGEYHRDALAPFPRERGSVVLVTWHWRSPEVRSFHYALIPNLFRTGEDA